MAIAVLIKNEVNKVVFEFITIDPNDEVKTYWDDNYLPARTWTNIYELIDYVQSNFVNLKVEQKTFNFSQVFDQL